VPVNVVSVAAETYFKQLIGDATVVSKDIPKGTIYTAVTASGETYILRSFSTTSMKTGIPEWTIQSDSRSLPGGLEEMKFRGQ